MRLTHHLEQQPAFDKIINAELMIQNRDEMAMGKVARRSLDADGRMTGTYHDNPFLNTITYNVEFPNARRTIDTTTQTSVRTQDPTLSCNYSTNNHMLRYRRIQDYFFMDTYFATKKGGQSS